MRGHRLTKVISVVLVVVLAVTVALFTTSCGQEEESDKIGVVVTILPQADFVKNVGGDKVKVTVMVPPGQSPHAYASIASQLTAVSKAKMYAKVGSGVEFETNHMDAIMDVNPDIHVVDCSEGITLMGSDPHIWNSPLNAKTMVENICNGLIQVDPDNADYYTQNKDNYLKELDILDGYIHYKLDVSTNRHFMIYHPAFGYFAEDYGLTQIPVEHSGKPPTQSAIQDCIDKAEQYHLQYVFVAPQFATAGCETIAHAIGGETRPMDPLPENYIANMGRIADLLALEFE